jgi:hypothetical protein
MSMRGCRVARQLIRQILKDNKRVRALKGGNEERGAAVTKAQNLLASITLVGDGREYVPTFDLNRLLGDIRSVAADKRTKASIRIKACVRLCAIEGITPLDELGGEPVDDLIRTLLAGQPHAVSAATPSTPVTPVGRIETMEETIARISREHEEG